MLKYRLIFFGIITSICLCSCLASKPDFSLTDTAIVPNGELIIDNYDNPYYQSIDLTDFSIESTKLLKISDDGLPIPYSLYTSHEQKLVVFYEKTNSGKLKYLVYTYPDLNLRSSEVINEVSIDTITKCWFKYFPDTSELYYRQFSDANGYIINLINHSIKKLEYNGEPVTNYQNFYYCLTNKYCFIQCNKQFEILFYGRNFLYSGNCIIYTNKDNCINIYDLELHKNYETTILAMPSDRFDHNYYKYQLLNKPLLIFSKPSNNIVLNFTAFFFELISGGFNKQVPCDYYLYNYEENKVVGKINNYHILTIKHYY